MLKKTIQTIFIVSFFAMASLHAGSAAEVLTKQAVLSHKAVISYKKRQSVALLNQIQTMKMANQQLRTKVRNPEIKNLLVFLNICLDEMKLTLKQPYSRDNVQILADLSVSIDEGTHYVKKTLNI
jgi:hypothetical protein